MRRWITAIGLGLLGGCASQAQVQRGGVPEVCRADVREHCDGLDRRALRACVQENLSAFSAGCRLEIREMRAERGGRRGAVDDEASGQSDRVPDVAPTRADVVYRTPPTGVAPSAVSLDFYAGPAGTPSPVVVFVHGGGWAIGDKRGGEHGHPAAVHSAGYAYVSLNYRLTNYGPPEVAADDIAAALAWLRQNAADLGIDPDRIVLMGHSAGAHLAALVALDPRYQLAQGVPSGAVDGVILLDGAGYDIATQVETGGNAELYETVFGTNRAHWRQMSPLTYADRADPPAFLIHHVASRQASGLQSEALARALRGAGGRVEVHAAEGETHASINRGFGEPGDETTQRTLAFLRSLYP